MVDFDESVLTLLESAFDAGELEVQLFAPDSGEMSYALKLIHKPTGIEIVRNDYDSHVKNKALALADLLNRIRQR
jgi:protein subunit release factor A